MRYVLLVFVGIGLSCLAHTATAQTVANSPARQRAENRRALRETRKYKADYKETHLAVTSADLKRSQSRALPRDGRGRYKFDYTGTPKVSEPSRVNLRLAKKKKHDTHSPSNL